MTQKRPINADTPPAVPKREPEPVESPSISPSAPGPRRRPIPGVLKAIAGLVIVAIVFLVAAIVGGGGGSEQATSGTTPPLSSGETDEAGGTPPATASNNTTRIGSSDPAATGAAVALAVYPSTTPAQRPGAVTLVGETWQNAVAATVLMAPPIQAPLLISSAGGPLPASEQALGLLDPKGIVLKKAGNRSRVGGQAYAIGPVATPALQAIRTAETTGAPQAAEIEALRNSLFREPPKHVVIAAEGDPAFAVPAAAWAARSGDPILYSRTDKLPAATATALKAHPKIPVYLLGPTSVISPAVMREVAKINKHVKRVSGKTPAENAIALARYADGSFGWNVNDPGHGFVVASSDSPLNAALAAPLSASGTWGPLLLTESADKLPQAVRQYLLDVKPGYTTDPTRAFYNHVWIVGDEEEIDANEQAEINQLAELTKVGGEG
jgi:hypothetical protein